MYCRNCGWRILEGAPFCSKCGTRVRAQGSGTWDLRAEATAPAPADAGTQPAFVPPEQQITLLDTPAVIDEPPEIEDYPPEPVAPAPPVPERAAPERSRRWFLVAVLGGG